MTLAECEKALEALRNLQDLGIEVDIVLDVRTKGYKDNRDEAPKIKGAWPEWFQWPTPPNISPYTLDIRYQYNP
nr:MAG TPA: hypothetical protein [Caudoviricetes sp.]